MEQILERAGEAVEFPDDYHIVGPELIEEPMQLRTIPPPARGLLGEQPLDACRPQGGLLQPGLLALAFRDPCIAQYHTASCCRNPLPLRSVVQQVCARGNPRIAVEERNRAQTLVAQFIGVCRRSK